MCILLVSTSHPDYALVLVSNRDEYLNRPTAPAAAWEFPHDNVFSGRDLARAEHGTWLGITKQGRLAVLTNFREATESVATGLRSRGAMVTAFLTDTSTPLTDTANFTTKDWIENALTDEDHGVKGMGGFSLFCGTLRPTNDGNLVAMAIISNRTESANTGEGSKGTHWVAGTRNETFGLSNSLFDNPWPKVAMGKVDLEEAIARDASRPASKEELINDLFGVISKDSLSAFPSDQRFESLRYSIFIPPFPVPDVAGEANGVRPVIAADKIASATLQEEEKKAMMAAETSLDTGHERHYGTMQQSVILVDKEGNVTYVERTRYNHQAHPVPKEESEKRIEFHIEGWS